jgi:hypothetical protein
MTNKDITKKAMLEALEKSLGVVTAACKSVDIARETHYRWMREDSDYKAAVEEIGDVAIDFAESQLHKQIKEGNSTATIFFLKTKGKKRGYVERQEVDVNTGKLFQIEVLGEDSHE